MFWLMGRSVEGRATVRAVLGYSRKTPVALALFALLAPGLAHAQGGNETAAQALYDEARRLMEAKDFAAACPKFKESYDLAAGGGTLLNLADCYEKAGKKALAWSTFKEALVIAQRELFAARIEFAKAHIAALEPTLSYVTVKVSNETKVPDLLVTIDGTPLGSAAWGVAVPVDPGKHVIRAEAAGHEPYEQTIEIPDSGPARETVSVPELRPLDDAQPGGPSGDGGVKADASASSGSGTRTIGWIAIAAGAVGVGVGSFFGLKAFSSWDDREAGCVNGCTQAAKDAGDSASSAATISTVAFAVGVGAIGVGTVLILTSGSGDKAKAASAPRLEASFFGSPSGGGLSVRQSW
jgi:hypothetical protein